MKRVISFIIIALIFTCCSNNTNNKTEKSTQKYNEPKVLYSIIDKDFLPNEMYHKSMNLYRYAIEKENSIQLIDINGNVLMIYEKSIGEVINPIPVDNMIQIGKDGRFGYINTEDYSIIKPIYSLESDFHEGFAFVNPASGDGNYINKVGLRVFDYYDKAGFFSDGYAIVTRFGDIKKNQFRILSFDGKEVLINHSLGISKTIGEKKYWGRLDGSVLFPELLFDMNGNIIGKINEEFVMSPFSENYSLAYNKENKKYYFVDKEANIVLDCSDFDEVSSFSNDRARVVKNDKFGFINKKGEIVIPIIYDIAGTFEYAVCYVEKDGLCGFIDINNNIVLEPAKRRVSNHDGKIALVQEIHNGQKVSGLIRISDGVFIDKEYLLTN